MVIMVIFQVTSIRFGNKAMSDYLLDGCDGRPLDKVLLLRFRRQDFLSHREGEKVCFTFIALLHKQSVGPLGDNKVSDLLFFINTELPFVVLSALGIASLCCTKRMASLRLSR